MKKGPEQEKSFWQLSSLQRSLVIVAVRFSRSKRIFIRHDLIKDDRARVLWEELYRSRVWERPSPPHATEIDRHVKLLMNWGYFENKGNMIDYGLGSTYELAVTKRATDEADFFMPLILQGALPLKEHPFLITCKSRYTQIIEQLIRNGDSKPLYSLAGEVGLSDPSLPHQDIWMFTYKSKAYARIGGLDRNNNAFNVLMIIPESEGHAFYYEIIYAVEQRLSANEKIKFEVVPPRKDSDFKEICSILEEGIMAGYDLIRLCAHWTSEEGKELGSIIANANSKGIKVVIYNDLTKLHGCKVDCYIGYDIDIACKVVADYLRKLGKGAKFGMLEGTEGQINTQRRDGLLRNLGEDRKSLHNIINAGWSAYLAEEKSDRFANTEVQVVTGLSSGMIRGALKNFEKIKREGGSTPQCIGWDGTLPELDLIRQGKLVASLNAFPRKQGEILADVIIEEMKAKCKQNEIVLRPYVIDISNVNQIIAT